MSRPSFVFVVSTLACLAAAANSAAEGVGAKPVLTESVDEPGRSPYQEFAYPDAICGFNCTFTFPAVPVGKRLIITYVNIAAPVVHDSGVVAYLSNSSAAYVFISVPIVSSSFILGDIQYTLGGFTQFYVEAGQAPALVIYGDFENAKPSVVINDYYIAV